MVVTARVFHKIFNITNPASMYLQTDKKTVIRLAAIAQSQLIEPQIEFPNVLRETKEVCFAHELEESTGEVCTVEVEQNTQSGQKKKLSSLQMTQHFLLLEGVSFHIKNFS